MIKILIVDDSPVIRIALKNALNRVDGFEVIGTASNGEEAIKENILKSPDIIIMDISMPVMD
ncbi:MAG TPA: response regulator, partial [Bacteroidetes bacterium]|nr:response regulator [Bacteroidota bacterium]